MVPPSYRQFTTEQYGLDVAQLFSVLVQESTQTLLDVDQLDAQGMVCRRGFDMVVTKFFPRQIPCMHRVQQGLVDAGAAGSGQQAVTQGRGR